MRNRFGLPVLPLALALLALCGPTASIAQAQDKSHLTTILEANTLRVGTTGDFNPMSIRDPASNSFKGFEIDAANQLAQDLGVKVEFVPTDWTTLVPGITANRYDIFMSGASMNVARIKTIAFTLPYLEAGTTPIFDQKNAGKFKSWDDINQPGVTVAVILGTVFEDQAKLLLPKATLKSVQPPATSWQEVLAGRADAAITSSIDAQSIVARFPPSRICRVIRIKASARSAISWHRATSSGPTISTIGSRSNFPRDLPIPQDKMVQQLKSAAWFVVVAGILLLVGGCAAGPSYNWGWYVLSPTQPRGLTNLEFLLGGLVPTISVSAAALAVWCRSARWSALPEPATSWAVVVQPVLRRDRARRSRSRAGALGLLRVAGGRRPATRHLRCRRTGAWVQ